MPTGFPHCKARRPSIALCHREWPGRRSVTEPACAQVPPLLSRLWDLGQDRSPLWASVFSSVKWLQFLPHGNGTESLRPQKEHARQRERGAESWDSEAEAGAFHTGKAFGAEGTAKAKAQQWKIVGMIQMCNAQLRGPGPGPGTRLQPCQGCGPLTVSIRPPSRCLFLSFPLYRQGRRADR